MRGGAVLADVIYLYEGKRLFVGNWKEEARSF